MFQRITEGHMPAGYGSYVPWGLWVALYFHGVGIAGGAFVIGALGYVRDDRGYTSPRALRTTIALAAAAIVPAFMAVWVDLGHMERATRIMTSPSFGSMMAFNAWMYSAFLAVAAAAWLLSRRGGSTWLKPLLCLGALLSILFPSQSGAFFGVVDAKAFWHSALLPILFLTSAVTSGAATLLVVREIVRGADGDDEIESAASKLRRIVRAGVVLYFILEFAEFSIALWNPYSHAPAVELVLWGPYWWVFWIVHVAAGGVLPLALLATASRKAWIAASALVAVTFVSGRLNVLVPGQAVGEIKGLQEAFHHDRLKYVYHATPMEYLVGLFLVAVGMAVFFVLRRLDGARREVSHA
jgi:molybdopterin-containing oxidoreductase family membrane subunit